MGMRKKKARSSSCNYSAIVCSFVNANKSRTVENKEKVGIIHTGANAQFLPKKNCPENSNKNQNILKHVFDQN